MIQVKHVLISIEVFIDRIIEMM